EEPRDADGRQAARADRDVHRRRRRREPRSAGGRAVEARARGLREHGVGDRRLLLEQIARPRAGVRGDPRGHGSVSERRGAARRRGRLATTIARLVAAAAAAAATTLAAPERAHAAGMYFTDRG